MGERREFRRLSWRVRERLGVRAPSSHRRSEHDHAFERIDEELRQLAVAIKNDEAVN